MIKIIAFDFVGVLVNEKDVELSDIEVQLERMFGPNINDSDYLIKPNADFYEYILNRYNITPRELLFIDDNIDNIKSANSLKINTIKVEKSTNLFFEITKVIDNCTFVN